MVTLVHTEMLSRPIRTISAQAPALNSMRLRTTTIRRTYATASVDSKPPVALYGLDGTYASALVWCTQ